MNSLLWLNAAVFGFFFMIWNTRNWHNTLIKWLLGVLWLANLYQAWN